MTRENIGSNTIWENVVGYSRAVRIGNFVYVSGTAALDGETVVAKGDAYAQTIFILKKIQNALNQAGADLQHVVRTRIYVADNINHWDAIAKAHQEVFNDIRPAATMVIVKGLVNHDLLVEIEADAVIETT